MPIGLLFWVLMILWLIFGSVLFWPGSTASGALAWGPMGYNLLIFVLLGLLGWKCFGPPIQGGSKNP